MRWFQPEIHSMVRDCSSSAGKVGHFEVMLQIMNYCVNTSNCGLILAPNQKQDGKDKNFEFEILGHVAMDPRTCKSVTQYVTFLEGAPVMFKSSTQKVISLLITYAK